MYCRMCGNKIDDTDRYCNRCGAPTNGQEKSSENTEPIEISEEVIFNPPYEGKDYPSNGLHLAEEDLTIPEKSPETEEPDKELKAFISGEDLEVEAHKAQEAAIEKPQTERTSEFSWDVKGFPTSSRKTEDIEFNWKLEEYGQIGKVENEEAAAGEEPVEEAAEVILEEMLFQEIRDEANRIKDTEIDKFFTFSKKNEEFQKLLDKEYEKFNRNSGPVREYFEVPDPEPKKTEEIPAEAAAVNEVPAGEAAAAEPEATPRQETQISEMAQARAAFFGDALVKDNDTIIKKLNGEEELVKPEEAQEEPSEQSPTVEIAASEEIIIPEPVAGEPVSQEPQPAEEILPEPEMTPDTKESKDASLGAAISMMWQEEEEPPKKFSVVQALLIIVAIILLAEISVLGIQYFAPNSSAAKTIGKTQTQIVESVLGWFDTEDASSEKESEKDAVKEDQKKTETPAAIQTTTEQSVTVPETAPMADKNALIATQLSNNVNIQKIQANTQLGYVEGKDYGLTDLNNSKPIANNVWLTPENGAPVYYDQSVVGTVIAYDSLWIDYVHGTNKNILDVLKKDSKAYVNTLAYKKIGKVKETFKLLEIGEIRQGAEGFYVWAHEEIQVTELGTTADKSYNWIYYLEPENGQMNIVNYLNLK